MTQRTFDAVRENLDQVLTFLDSQLESWDCPMRVQMQLDVAVEELFVILQATHMWIKPELPISQ